MPYQFISDDTHFTRTWPYNLYRYRQMIVKFTLLCCAAILAIHCPQNAHATPIQLTATGQQTDTLRLATAEAKQLADVLKTN